MNTDTASSNSINSAWVNMPHPGFRFVLPVLLLLITLNSPLQAANINVERVEKGHALQNIRTQIKDVESRIDNARKDVDALFNQLRDNELAAVEAADKIQSYQHEINSKNQQLTQLGKDKDRQEALLDTQRQHLAIQIRKAYKTGRNNYLKLLLNQEDPALVGRLLAYYEYDTQARSKHITNINAALAEISSLEKRIQTQAHQLSQLQGQQEAKLAEFQAYRSSRQQITTALRTYIDDQGVQLQILQKNEQALSKLLSELEDQELALQIFEDTPPFNSLRGKLDWPVRGKITSRFGSWRKDGKLKWQGVTIAAGSGIEVKAITTGKVVFADWFRNMGLLVILDHGDGFMSLYGHNERLLKKPGDWVLAGDLIARVGDSGGQQRSGLYFEIRHGGNPVNPNLWCQN